MGNDKHIDHYRMLSWAFDIISDKRIFSIMSCEVDWLVLTLSSDAVFKKPDEDLPIILDVLKKSKSEISQSDEVEIKKNHERLSQEQRELADQKKKNSFHK